VNQNEMLRTRSLIMCWTSECTGSSSLRVTRHSVAHLLKQRSVVRWVLLWALRLVRSYREKKRR